MEYHILCALLMERLGVNPKKFEVHGQEVVFFDPNEDKGEEFSHVSPYDTPENRAIVADVIKNYDTLSKEYLKTLESMAYKSKRANEYPDFKEYLDGIVKGDQSQIDKYIADCLAIKAKYPKEA